MKDIPNSQRRKNNECREKWKTWRGYYWTILVNKDKRKKINSVIRKTITLYASIAFIWIAENKWAETQLQNYGLITGIARLHKTGGIKRKKEVTNVDRIVLAALMEYLKHSVMTLSHKVNTIKLSCCLFVGLYDGFPLSPSSCFIVLLLIFTTFCLFHQHIESYGVGLYQKNESRVDWWPRTGHYNNNDCLKQWFIIERRKKMMAQVT